jgi:hypothetical protein
MDSGGPGPIGVSAPVLVVQDGKLGNEVAVHLITEAKAVSVKPENAGNAANHPVLIQAN